MCMGTLVHYEQAVRLSSKGDEWPGWGVGCSECVQVNGHTMSKEGSRHGCFNWASSGGLNVGFTVGF